jgi:hypothetical protein
MRKRLIFLLALLAALASTAFAQSVPVVDSIDHAAASVGEVITAVGVNLDKAKVADVFLTDGITDTQVILLEQKPGSLKFKIPKNAMPGLYNIMLQTTQDPPMLLVQPVRCEIISDEEE